MFDYLIIDDDDASRQSLSEGLSGFCDTGIMKSARNARDAVAIMEDYIPDVILIDVVMPFIDGLEILKRIRFDKRFDNSIILMMSSIMLDHVAQAAMSNKADYCLWKPVNIRLLRECVYSILAARQCDLSAYDVIDEGSRLNRLIRDQLDEVGVPISTQGYELLSVSIQIVCEREQPFKMRIVDDVYARVAQMYAVSISCVERSIRSAIKLAWERNPELISRALYANRKPKTSEFIAKITQIVRESIYLDTNTSPSAT